jgi:hypothetical protein
MSGATPRAVARRWMVLNHKGGRMLSFRWLAIGAGVASFSAGAAIAGSQSGETTAVTADFQAAVVSQKQRQCDASHMKFRVKFEGTQTSADPRLSGKVTIRAVSVVNTQNGYGYTRAKVRVRDAATGNPKLHGLAVGVIEPDGGSEGLLSARTVGPNSMRLLANFNVSQDAASGALTGEFGKDSQTGAAQDPAILSDACKGGRGKHDAAKGKRKGHGPKTR